VIGLKVRVTDKASLTIIPKKRRRVAITMLPAIPGGGGGGFTPSFQFNDPRNSQYLAVIY
jgi:hypothetical protein